MSRTRSAAVLVASVALGLLCVPAAGSDVGGVGFGGDGVLLGGGSQGYRLRRIPTAGAVPAIYDTEIVQSRRDLSRRAEARDYRAELLRLRRSHLGPGRREALRAEGLVLLREFTDPAAMLPMAEVYADAPGPVLEAVIDHLQSQGEEGQAALAMLAIRAHRTDNLLRDEALARIARPASGPVLREIDLALRSNDHAVANGGAFAANVLNALPAIPLLIFAQATEDRRTPTGDLAWIAIRTQQSYVANVLPVVGDGAGAFQPVIGVVNEGALLRVMDAVVVTYRTDVHDALVAMTSSASGEATASMGYHMGDWYRWYNDRFLPLLAERERLRALEESAETVK